MPEHIKQCVENAAKTISSIPADKREMAVRLAETYATGLAVGMELAGEGKDEATENPAQL